MLSPFDEAMSQFFSSRQQQAQPPMQRGQIFDVISDVLSGLSPAFDTMARNRQMEESLAESKDIQHMQMAGADLPGLKSVMGGEVEAAPNSDPYKYLKEAALLDLQNAGVSEADIRRADDIGAAKAGGYMLMDNGSFRTIDERAYNDRLAQISPAQTGRMAVEENILAQYGIDPATMTQIDPTLDGFTERPVSMGSLPPEAQLALMSFAQKAAEPPDRQILQLPGGGISAVDKNTLEETVIRDATPERDVYSIGGRLVDATDPNAPREIYASPEDPQTREISGKIVSKDPITGEWDVEADFSDNTVKPSRIVKFTDDVSYPMTLEQENAIIKEFGVTNLKPIASQLTQAITPDYISSIFGNEFWSGESENTYGPAALYLRASNPIDRTAIELAIDDIEDKERADKARQLFARILGMYGLEASTSITEEDAGYSSIGARRN